MRSWISQFTSARSLLLSEQLLQLHRLAHVALDLQLSGHVGRGRVLLALGDLHERLGRCRDSGVGIAAVLGDGYVAVVDVNVPRARAVDLEPVAARHPGRLDRVDPRLQRLEELSRALGHAREVTAFALSGATESTRHFRRPPRAPGADARAATEAAPRARDRRPAPLPRRTSPSAGRSSLRARQARPR